MTIPTLGYDFDPCPIFHPDTVVSGASAQILPAAQPSQLQAVRQRKAVQTMTAGGRTKAQPTAQPPLQPQAVRPGVR
jgi:hypothetical protein